MHRCLEILELVDTICSNLMDWGPGYASLAALAQTCKFFHGPALDCLWERQDTLWNILSCMPVDLFEIYSDPPTSELGSDGGEQHLRLLRPIVAADWERPLRYTHRVRFLSSGPFWDNIDVSRVFPALSASLPGDCVFPMVTTLRWLHVNESFVFIRMFISPTLRSLDFSSNPSNTNLSILPTLVRTCTGLKHVGINFGRVVDSRRAAVSAFVRALPCLESLTVDIPDVAALQHIGRLPTLTSLTIASLPEEFFHSPSLDASLFPSLIELTLERVKIEPVTEFLRVCSDTPLRNLCIIIEECPSTAATHGLFAAIKAACSHISLTSLDLVNYCDPSPTIGQEYVISNDSMRLLFGFQNLREINVTAPLGFALDDATIADVACAWPRATNLSLKSFAGYKRPRLSLNCLHVFSRHCPDLVHLELTLDASFIPATTVAVPSPHGLKSLNVGESLISAPALVAGFISAIFPHLDEISTYRSTEDNEDEWEVRVNGAEIAIHEIWMEVGTQIQTIRAQGHLGTPGI
ncbi:hypothetical protein C8R44DRAFT_812160 [Mycena epipterygia]|nr:hypothetical protein C8R44DRAFT_812160 [Mycena epipterygia]